MKKQNFPLVILQKLFLNVWSVLFLFSSVYHGYAQQLAFPSADGYGKYVTGGRGGAVIEVTNLNDDNLPGSLRHALNQSGARTIVFRVSGTIALNSSVNITNGDLTIAGQTAPGDGICVKNYKFNISASNVIIRYIRLRLGDAKVWGDDAFGGYSSKNSAGTTNSLPIKNIMIDHCSVSYGSDETLSIYDIENLTVQWCIISESLNKDGHGFGGIMGGWGASLHHTLFAHHKSRSPRFCGARYQFNLKREVVDMRNNVIYNAGYSYGGEGGHHNVINNYYKRGGSYFCNPTQPNPSTTDNEFVGCIYDSIFSTWYVDGNYMYGNAAVTVDNWNGGVKVNYPQLNIRIFNPLPSAYLGPNETAEEAFVKVCNDAGATLPKRDTVDKRVVSEVRNNTGKVPLTMADVPGEAFPTLNSLDAPKDDDHDGMPNDWEIARGLNPNSANDRNNIGQNGYTQLEVYLGSLTGEITNFVPVELTSFTATVSGITIQLRWITATEVNNVGFEIERRSVGSQQSAVSSWQKVSFVSGNGTSNISREYFYAENNLPGGKYFYRLRQIDSDGTCKYSKEIEITFGAIVKDFKMQEAYPNPFNPSTSISYQLPFVSKVTLKVYDILGCEVAKLADGLVEAGNHTVTFNGSNLSSGIYLAHFQAESFNQTIKLILSK
ncbi:MAG: T9SS type A sorting domain-containing protein [Ignavibacteria bacterium]|nr:T9SS type A sorting domain-containing protein [Ignavibacteria bacterium]